MTDEKSSAPLAAARVASGFASQRTLAHALHERERSISAGAWRGIVQRLEDGRGVNVSRYNVTRRTLFAVLGVEIPVPTSELGNKPGSVGGGARVRITLAAALRRYLDTWKLSHRSVRELARRIARVNGTPDSNKVALAKIERGDEPGPTMRRIAAALAVLDPDGWLRAQGGQSRELGFEERPELGTVATLTVHADKPGVGRAGLSHGGATDPAAHRRNKPGLQKTLPASAEAESQEQLRLQRRQHGKR